MLFQNISLLQHDISVSDSLSLRLFRSMVGTWNSPSWFNYQGMRTSSVTLALPENWYVSDKFLGFAVCFSGNVIDSITAHLIPSSCDDGMSSMTQQFALSYNPHCGNNFLLIPLGGLWDESNANGKTPNDYGCIRLYFSREIGKYGVRLLYKDEAELQIGIRKSRYEEEATCSSSKKQRQLLQLFPTSPGL
ncbi:TMV resistance protein N-like [Solanum stenotomum]|uniref:TMV resistance protein N-like n=1 Tax=Solanum stenotomum TaxID=172797 RepID=UPI0020D192A1|nr:TMV resistance protein N-like [Solanum stenotomum]